MHQARVSQQESHMEGEEIFGFYKQKPNLPPRLKGNSHKHDRVIFLAHMSTPKLENHIHIMSGLHVTQIHMRMWIQLMVMPRSLKLLAEMQFGI